MVREDRYKKYAVVGTFESWDDWVLLGDAQGKAKLFQIGSYDQVRPEIGLANPRLSNGKRWVFL